MIVFLFYLFFSPCNRKVRKGALAVQRFDRKEGRIHPTQVSQVHVRQWPSKTLLFLILPARGSDATWSPKRKEKKPHNNKPPTPSWIENLNAILSSLGTAWPSHKFWCNKLKSLTWQYKKIKIAHNIRICKMPNMLKSSRMKCVILVGFHACKL